MSQLSNEQIEALTREVRSQEHLRRLVAEVERLHRVVFHGAENADWSRVTQSAEQIVIAEIVVRQHGRGEGVFFDLRAMEDAGASWDAAICALAERLHSYYTTPLGILMRRDLLGAQSVFISPDADTWTKMERTPDEPARPTP